MNDWRTLKNRILKDVRVELLDEFDQNFTRKAFFDQPWPQRSYPGGRGSLMIGTSRMRNSLRGIVQQNGIVFYSDTPYMGIHNHGGKIKITPRMRKYFWFMYRQNTGSITYSIKKRQANNTKNNRALSDKAQFWRNMALTKKTEISIPARPVIGDHPRVRDVVNRCINDNLQRSVKSLADVLNKRR